MHSLPQPLLHSSFVSTIPSFPPDPTHPHSIKMGINSPLPVNLPAECRKAAKIIRSFVDSSNDGLDKVIPRSVMAEASVSAIVNVGAPGQTFSMLEKSSEDRKGCCRELMI